jgi:CBS domain-containing protein
MAIHLIGPQRLIDIAPELAVQALVPAPARPRDDRDLAVTADACDWLANVVVDCPRYGTIDGKECIDCAYRVSTLAGPRPGLICKSDGSDPVSDWMSLHPTLAHADDRCDAADAHAADADVHHLLVLDDKRRLVGVICRCDLAGGGDTPVSARMQEDVFAVEPRASLGLAVAVMKRLAIHCLPVVSGPLLVGVLTAGDLARAGVAPR